ncbi:MAG: hypothetical protein ACLP5H_30425 [Desulfomonilaceae bacterium]
MAPTISTTGDNPGNFPCVDPTSVCGEGRFKMVQHCAEGPTRKFALLPSLLSYAQWVREGHTDEWWTRATHRWPDDAKEMIAQMRRRAS